jgi:antitoxin component YwqK of YwqJK toxin-antitoxin module
MLQHKKLTLILSLFALLFLSACTSPSFGKKVEKKYYTGGQLMSEFIWSDSTGKNGTMRMYGFDGKQVSSVNITNSVKNGIESQFDGEGRVIRQTPYVNGNVHGTDKVFYPNGDRKITFTYRNGVRDGYAYSYYADGRVCKKAKYKNNRLVN